MPGIPQLREAAWLYSPDDDRVPIALVRLEQRMDGSGIWVVLVNDPAKAPTQHGEFVTEAAARAELDRLYALGRLDGEWRVHRPHAGPTVGR